MSAPQCSRRLFDDLRFAVVPCVTLRIVPCWAHLLTAPLQTAAGLASSQTHIHSQTHILAALRRPHKLSGVAHLLTCHCWVVLSVHCRPPPASLPSNTAQLTAARRRCTRTSSTRSKQHFPRGRTNSSEPTHSQSVLQQQQHHTRPATVRGDSTPLILTPHPRCARRCALYCQLESRTWDEPGRSTSVYHLPLLGNKAHWTIQSLALPNDRGNTPNPFNLSHSQLAQRHIVHTSLTDDQLIERSQSQSQHPQPSEDPRLFHSASRPTPLTSSYATSCAPPFVCLYSLLDVYVGIWGVQSRAEDHIGRELTAVWCRLLRLVWCWQDEWRGRSWRDECDKERSDAQASGGDSANNGSEVEEQRVAAGGWQRYLSDLRSNGGALSGTVFGGNVGHPGEMRSGSGDGGGADVKWPKRALTGAVNKWKMRSRL